MKPITILLADDHPLVREGVRSSFKDSKHFLVVAEAGDGEAALRLARKVKPNIVMLDVTMPRMNGLETARRIRGELPKTAIIVLSVHADTAYIQEMMRLGARGYLLKDCGPMELRRAVEAVHRGQSHFPQGMPSVDAEPPGYALERLSARERQVLTLVAEGLSNKEISHKLSVSVRTVEAHRDHITNKLSLRGTASLTRFAIYAGLVTVHK
jgi:DNA-binding NarL/FixJ family response regulator